MTQADADMSVPQPQLPVRREPSVQLSITVALLFLAVLCCLAALFGPGDILRLMSVTCAAVLASMAAVISYRQLSLKRARIATQKAIMSIMEGDLAAVYVTDDYGDVVQANRAARERGGRQRVGPMRSVLADVFAQPELNIARLQDGARQIGRMHEEVTTRRGHVRISVQSIDPDGFMWSIEEVFDRTQIVKGAEALSLPMMTAGPSGTILFMNDAFRRLTGGRARTLADVFPDMPLSNGAVHEVEGPDGPVQSLVAQVPCSGGRTEIYLLPPKGFDNVASRSAGWSEIEELPVPLLKLTVAGEVIAANREARALLPMPIGPGTRLSDMLDGLGRPIADWLADVASGKASADPQFLRGVGVHRETHVQLALRVAGPSEAPYLLAVLSDATELKSLELQFVQSQKMQAIGQLAGGVAHDFNNLLTAISGHCDLLLLRHDQGDQDYSDLIQIHQNTNRAASLVGQLLAFSRKQSLIPEVIDLRDTLSDMTHLLNRLVGERVNLSLSNDPQLRCIRADKRQLEQVLMNLVVNARDAMPDGGEIRVETENVILSEPMQRDQATLPPGDYVVLHVVDEGVGIAPDKLPHIFEPFVTTKRPGEGTGLGLSTAYGIVKQTGGYIFADSTENRGSRFSLYFPGHDAPKTATVAPVVEAAISAQDPVDGVVLLVEDEAPVRAFASRALKMRGYSVLEAESAEAALELLSDPELSVDIFVTDVIMPGKDGPTWVREALESRPDTRVVFVSGYAEDAFSEHKSLIPNSVFLPKPFSLNELTSTVQRQLC